MPQNCSGWSFLDVSLNIYNHYLSVKRVAKEIGGFFADMFYYQSNVKSIAKAEKLRKKKFVSQQVRAMRLAFVRFNTSCECMEDSKGVVCYTNRPFSSIWEERSSSLGMYRVRNKHCSYTNRRIARHWTDGKFSIVK